MTTFPPFHNRNRFTASYSPQFIDEILATNNAMLVDLRWIFNKFCFFGDAAIGAVDEFATKLFLNKEVTHVN